MNKSKILSLLVIVMLIINIGIISYFVFMNKENSISHQKRMPREIVIEKLSFNQEQIAAYDETIKRHQNAIRTLDDSIRNKKNQLYSRLKNNASEIDKNDSLVIELGNYQKQIETTHFNHFIEIKNICKPEQLDDFNSLTSELSKIFSGKRKPKHEK